MFHGKLIFGWATKSCHSLGRGAVNSVGDCLETLKVHLSRQNNRKRGCSSQLLIVLPMGGLQTRSRISLIRKKHLAWKISICQMDVEKSFFRSGWFYKRFPFSKHTKQVFDTPLVQIWDINKLRWQAIVQFPMSPTKRKSIPVTTNIESQPRAPTKTGRYRWLSYYHNV